MNDTGGIIRMVTAAACCAAVILYSSYCQLFTPVIFAESVTATDTTESKVNSNYEIIPEISAPSDTQAAESQSASTTTPPQAVAAASDATVQGKIVEKFISPYTAKYAYNNVYLKNSTGLDIDLKSLLNAKLSFKINKSDKPQVLIVHTHATESFMLQDRDYYTTADSSRNTDEAYNMVKLGKIVADKLNTAGIKTLHDTTLHDYPSYNESYSRAAKTITSYTSKYDSIKIVIDIHRDAIAANDTDKVKLTTQIDGKKAAQVMLVMGSQSGSVTNFPNWQENLKLAVKLQQTLEVMYPSLARSISLTSKNYNESLTTGSMLIEMGTDGNTLEEVSYSAELLGNALVSLLNTLG